MASELTISASTRAERGRHVHAVRREGLVPAVLYGHNLETSSIATDGRTLERTWRRAGRTHLVDLVVDGGKARKVLIRDIQFNPRTNAPLHVDFYAVNLKEKLTAEVPVVVVGDSPVVSEQKIGQVLQTLTHLRVECLPQDLPAQITIDVTPLDHVEAHITVGELQLPPGVALVHADPDEILVKISAVRVASEDEAAEAEAAGETPAEQPAGGSEGEPAASDAE